MLHFHSPVNLGIDKISVRYRRRGLIHQLELSQDLWRPFEVPYLDGLCLQIIFLFRWLTNSVVVVNRVYHLDEERDKGMIMEV